MTCKWYRRVLQEEKAKRGDRCYECGLMDTLEFHHLDRTEISGRGRGSNQRAADIRKYPEKYVLLCRQCHKEAHPEIFQVYSSQQRLELDQVNEMDDLGRIERRIPWKEVMFQEVRK